MYDLTIRIQMLAEMQVAEAVRANIYQNYLMSNLLDL
jgi:hypothetical protein